MSIDYKYVNFKQDHELNRILRKYNKRQTERNREILIEYGQECKTKLEKKRLTHEQFNDFINFKTKLDKLEELED